LDARRFAWPTAYLVLAALACSLYLFAARREFGLGFPLDDAWIHQTYARNLVQYREWSFQPGSVSGGSTSPLWTSMLAVGALLGLDARAWAYILGACALGLTAWAAQNWLVRRVQTPRWGWMVGIAVLFEWHLVWAGVSGMETIVETLLIVLVFLQLEAKPIQPIRLGACLGLGAWIRPDALTLLVPVAWLLATDRAPIRGRLRRLGLTLLGLALVFVPYLVFNRLVGGAWWPTTFYAKQAEYAVLRQAPLVSRLSAQLIQPMIGVGVLLLPGLALATWRASRKAELGRLAPIVWAIMFMSLYALRLPVTYQHGRYVIPTIPVILVIGIEGLVSTAPSQTGAERRRWTRLAWPASAGGVLLGFWLLGAQAYARDVSIIESEMVAASRWIASNTDPEALIAAHDIGALGYFGRRSIIDLAGLATPEVIPILRDEGSLAEYLNRHGADYLMTFPAWYPNLTGWAQPVFRTGAPFSPAAGGENMVVYRWEAAKFASPGTSMLYSPHSRGGRLEHGNDTGHYR